MPRSTHPKLKGPVTWTYFYLYVILDVFSRYVVGWMAAYRESATLAQRLIDETCARQAIAKGQLTIHADRGSAMIRSVVAANNARSLAFFKSQNPRCTLTKSRAMEDAGGSLSQSRE